MDTYMDGWMVTGIAYENTLKQIGVLVKVGGWMDGWIHSWMDGYIHTYIHTYIHRRVIS